MTEKVTSLEMDGIISSFPQPYTEYACLRSKQMNFHGRTREACQNGNAGNVSLKVVKTIAIGDISVGKTSIINRYCRNLFQLDYKPTIGVEYEVKKYEILEQEFHLQIWDTSGEERFRCITGAYYRGAQAIILVFDLSNALSLANCSKWLEDALEKTRSTSPDIFLVGNKLDIMKPGLLEETRESAIDLANQINAEYWEVSAKSGKNVADFFSRVAAMCFDQAVLRELGSGDSKSKKVALGNGIRVPSAGNQEVTDTIVLGQPHNPAHNGAKVHSSYRERSRCCK